MTGMNCTQCVCRPPWVGLVPYSLSSAVTQLITGGLSTVISNNEHKRVCWVCAPTTCHHVLFGKEPQGRTKPAASPLSKTALASLRGHPWGGGVCSSCVPSGLSDAGSACFPGGLLVPVSQPFCGRGLGFGGRGASVCAGAWPGPWARQPVSDTECPESCDFPDLSLHPRGKRLTLAGGQAVGQESLVGAVRGHLPTRPALLSNGHSHLSLSSSAGSCKAQAVAGGSCLVARRGAAGPLRLSVPSQGPLGGGLLLCPGMPPCARRTLLGWLAGSSRHVVCLWRRWCCPACVVMAQQGVLPLLGVGPWLWVLSRLSHVLCIVVPDGLVWPLQAARWRPPWPHGGFGWRDGAQALMGAGVAVWGGALGQGSAWPVPHLGRLLQLERGWEAPPEGPGRDR